MIKQFEIWLADWNHQSESSEVKPRPVIVVQTNLLNKLPHPSTIICPITFNVKPEVDILRVHLLKSMANLPQDSDIMIDQIQVIANKRFIQRLGDLPVELIEKVKENILISLDLE